jgi:uncharacterized membrane protein YdcZ (DUF606 family)
MNQKIYAILLLAALAVGTFSTLSGAINVQAATTQKTYAISDAIPNPVGVGEETLDLSRYYLPQFLWAFCPYFFASLGSQGA